MKHWKYGMMLLICLLLLMWGAAAETDITAEEKRTAGNSDSYVSYPVFSSASQAETAEKINLLLNEKARIQDYENLMKVVEEGATGIQMDYRMIPQDGTGDYVSIIFSARGKMLQGPPSQVYYAVTVDMRSGEEVKADQIFTDDALGFLENYMEETVAPTLSTYLENSDLLPVPMEHFALDETGVTFFYPNRQLSFLSGDSGAVTIPYYELESVLQREEDSVIESMKLLKTAPDDTTTEKIREAALQGMLANLPVRLGDDLEEALNTLQCTVDAGYYPGGAYYEVEDSRMRDAVLLTDEAETEIFGIYTRRAELEGIITGKTTREEWQNLLGEPDFSMEMGETDGEMYLLCAGTSDFYEWEHVKLTLHADQNGVLYAAVLSK